MSLEKTCEVNADGEVAKVSSSPHCPTRLDPYEDSEETGSQVRVGAVILRSTISA